MLAFPKQFLAAELDLSVSVSKDHTALETTSADCDEVAWEGPFYVGKLLGKLNSQTEEFIVIVSNRTEILRHFACSTEIGDGRGKGQLEPFYRYWSVCFLIIYCYYLNISRACCVAMTAIPFLLLRDLAGFTLPDSKWPCRPCPTWTTMT